MILIILRSRSFEYELASYSQHFIRPPCGNVRSHMISCIHGPLVGVETRLVHQVAKYYGVLMIAIEVFRLPSHPMPFYPGCVSQCDARLVAGE